MKKNELPHHSKSALAGYAYLIDDPTDTKYIIRCSDGIRFSCDDIVSCKETVVGNQGAGMSQIPLLIVQCGNGTVENFPEAKVDDDILVKELALELQTARETKTFVSNYFTLDHYFPLLIYPYHLWYDELSETLFSDIDGKPSQLNDSALIAILAHVEGRYESFNRDDGCMKVRWTVDCIKDTIMREAYKNTRNPFREWIESLTWDGKSRVATMFQDFLAATNDPKYLKAVACAWMVGAVKRQYSTIRHEVIPSLIGPQGVGKTSFFIRLGCGYYASTQINMDMPAMFLDTVRGCVIVELGEGKSIRKDIEATKEFLSKASDRIRKPYHRTEEDYPRHFVVALTSNTLEFLNDQTGARRFYPINCTEGKRKFDPRPDPTAEESAYVEQLWAEAYAMYKAGVPSMVGQDVAEIALMEQKKIIEFDDDAAEVECWLDDPLNGYADVGAMVPYRWIMEGALHVAIGTEPRKEVTAVYKRWRSMTKCWSRVPHAVRVDGKVYNGVMVRVKAPETVPDSI